VHIKDLIELYLLVLKSALDPASSYTSPLENFYFGSVEEHEWGAIASQIARILFKKGVLRTAEVQEVTFEQYPELENNGNNSRSVANRGKKLGWVPQERSIKDTLEEDIDAVLKGW
jgi:nucleoside-diphosphate-sugar epimerase